MSDEIRAEDEVEAHGGLIEGGTVEGGVLEGGTMEATEDDDADFEAHGGFVEGGVVENTKGLIENAK
jgi:hypothetical protein